MRRSPATSSSTTGPLAGSSPPPTRAIPRSACWFMFWRETGARPSQAARLLVEDLHGGARPRLAMPRSAKGGSKNRVARKAERINVPISEALAASLKAAAKGRAADAPLLLRADGQPWSKSPSDDYRSGHCVGREDNRAAIPKW